MENTENIDIVAPKNKEVGNDILPNERVTVYATDKAPHHAQGEEIVTAPSTAAYFVEKGFATVKKEAAKAPKA
jgi:hypothetical protein